MDQAIGGTNFGIDVEGNVTKAVSFCNGERIESQVVCADGCQGTAMNELNEKNEQTNLIPPSVAGQSVGKVILLYWKHCTVAKRTARNNAMALLKILEVVDGRKRQAEVIPLTEINAATISTYQNTMLNNYSVQAPPDLPAQKEARERALRTSRSTIIQARCLFSRRGYVDLQEIYQQNGIQIPDCVQGFCNAKVRGKSTKTEYKAPADEVVTRSMDSIELMRADADVYCAFWLAIGAGLRKGEIRFCEWDFLKVVDGKPRIMGGFGKGGEQINVPIQSRAYMQLAPFKDRWQTQKEIAARDGLESPGPFVIRERGDKWSRRLSAWMRSCGWQTRKTTHELRAFLGSQLYSKCSPVTAMRVLRHKSIQVTEGSYVRYGLQADTVDVL